MRKKAWILCTAMVVALAGCSNVSENNTTDIIQVSSEMVTTAATESQTTESQSQEGEPSDDSWKEEFEKTLYEEYGVVPDHYEYIGNDVYQVYVKIDGKIVPYVAVNWKTGDFHG